MTPRKQNQPEQNFLSFLLSCTQPTCIPSVSRSQPCSCKPVWLCASPSLEPLAPEAWLPVTPGSSPSRSFSSAFSFSSMLLSPLLLK
ncbi:hypothetical protein A930011G24 [Mus musculus]|nr:hypothetical protein A930011G24 [Mus musculus]